MKMVTTYNTKDLVKFGQYLLSQEREDRLKSTSIENPKALSYEERKRQVYDADVQNWKEAHLLSPSQQKTTIKRGGFEEACKPLMKWLAENVHPHHKAIVESNKSELLEGQRVFNSDEFLVD